MRELRAVAKGRRPCDRAGVLFACGCAVVGVSDGGDQFMPAQQGRAFELAKYLSAPQCFPGQIVVTPVGALAQISAQVIGHGEASVALDYLFADEQGNQIQCKHLRAYAGPNVVFPKHG